MADKTAAGDMLADFQYARIIRAVIETPWAITPGMLAVITNLLSFRASGQRLSKDEIRARIGAEGGPRAEGAARVGVARSGDVAVIPLRGVVAPYADLFSDVSGMATLDRFRARFREALADEAVGSILLFHDSPGGSVDLVPETFEEIFAARGGKPIVAIANTLSASASYWLLTAADEVVVTPSGEVGSIGVYSAHTDYSKLLEEEGIKTTLIRAGKYKVEANPFEPLSDDARAAIQARVDDYYAMFVKAVAKGRGVKPDDVRNGFGEGRCVGASQALKLGMADRVATFEDTIQRLRGGRKPKGSRPSGAVSPGRHLGAHAFL